MFVLRHRDCRLRPVITNRQIRYICNTASNTGIKRNFRHSALCTHAHSCHDLIQILGRNIIDNQNKIGIVIEKIPIMRDFFQINLDPVGKLLAFHGIHGVEIACGDQHHLKSAIHIKIRKQLLPVGFLIIGLFHRTDQGIGYLFIRISLQKNTDAEILDHIRKKDLPRNDHQREIVRITVLDNLLWHFHNIFSHINNQPCGMMPEQILQKRFPCSGCFKP